MKLKVLEFRKLTTSDLFDDYYNDGYAWSRIYEYPAVINRIKRHVPDYSTVKIHNSSWGFEGIHVKFKEQLDLLSPSCVHSDIKHSKLPKTCVYDIRYPSETLKDFDVVVNVSTMEEVSFDHDKILFNLLSQVSNKGYFIATFDLPGLQLEKIEDMLKKKLDISGEALNGVNSHLPNPTCKHLNVGIMVLNILK